MRWPTSRSLWYRPVACGCACSSQSEASPLTAGPSTSQPSIPQGLGTLPNGQAAGDVPTSGGSQGWFGSWFSAGDSSSSAKVSWWTTHEDLSVCYAYKAGGAASVICTALGRQFRQHTRVQGVTKHMWVQDQPPPPTDLSDDKYGPPPMPQELRSDFR